jgi:hypothetical protein
MLTDTVRPMQCRPAPFLACLFLGALALPCPARAADHFLTIGGGYAPSGNQVSLELNVLFYRQALSDLYGDNALAHDVYFSDGDAPGRDVQYDDPASDVPEVNRLLARLDDDEDDLGYRYRTHAVQGVSGPSTRKAIEQWFAAVAPKIPDGDRLILYVTGHGSHDDGDDGKRYDNNFIELWNGDTLSVRELATLLDRLSPGVKVVVVMVQCYSGGFADLIFTGGQSDLGPARGVRCGFFATMPDRTAAGCTPDVNEAGYQDYSSSFWAALRGRTRTGAEVPLKDRDFDNDGVVTFAEAHAYVMLTDDSIDVPMTTSDRFLRLHSDTGAGRGRLISAEDMLARLNAVATPADRAVIDGLSKQLGLGAAPPGAQYRYAAAKELSESLKARHKAGEQREKSLRDEYDDARDAIRDSLELRWPEIVNRWDPAVERIIREEGDAVVAAIKSDPEYRQFTKLHADLDELATRDDELEKKWAKCHRLMRTLERVALASNIAKVADEETLARYKVLVDAEKGTLGEAVKR